MNADANLNNVTRIFSRPGEGGTARAIIALLKRGPA